MAARVGSQDVGGSSFMCNTLRWACHHAHSYSSWTNLNKHELRGVSVADVMPMGRALWRLKLGRISVVDGQCGSGNPSCAVSSICWSITVCMANRSLQDACWISANLLK